MKPAFKISALFLLFILLAGCVQFPIENAGMTKAEYVSYELKADAGIGTYTTYIGPVTDVADDWVGNCTEKMVPLFDTLSAMLDMSTQAMAGIAGATGEAPEPSDEQKQQIADSKQAIELMKNSISCNFSRDNGTGTLAFGFDFSYDEVTLLSGLETRPTGMTQGSSTMDPTKLSIEKQDDGTIRTVIPISDSTSPTSNSQTEEIRIKVEGELVSMSPENYFERDGFYIFSMVEFTGDEIAVVYKPASFGFELSPFTTTLLIVIGILVLALIILFLIGRKKGEHEDEAVSPRRMRRMAQEETPKPEKRVAPVATGKDPDVERIVDLLKGQKKIYSRKELRKAILDEGFSILKTEEILKRIYG